MSLPDFAKVIEMEEIWKDIPGYEGLYQVSNYGQIRSLDRVIWRENRWGDVRPHKYKGHILTQHFDGRSRYLVVNLSRNGKSKNELVHRLIAITFLGLNEGLDVNHVDGNKTNNTVDNLEWVTRSENLKHALRTGLMESQCKIRRPTYMINRDSGFIIEFPDMISCCRYFSKSKCWIKNRTREVGNPFDYLKYRIYISERRENE